MNEPLAEPKRDVTRRRLLEVAAGRFAARGYHGTSYSDLIAATGLSKGAFYHHYRSKQELALAVYEAKQSELVGQLRAISDSGAPLLEQFFEQLRRRARAFARDPGLMCLPRLAADFARDAELRPWVEALHRPALEQFAELIRRGQALGEIRADLRPEAVARTTFAALVGMTELAKQEGEGSDQGAETEDLIELLSAALRPPGRGPSGEQREASRAGGVS
ncbi:TetR/AcrR family transcriptional regulator [Myxococcota bacterium]|nr:TetR/AcrR family transcriptional regulator [Myxococcota bacterium]